MKNLKSCSALLFLTWTASISLANNRVGNGGDVVVCPKSSEILDFYESSDSVQIFAAAKGRNQILEDVLENLERLNPTQSKQYKKRVAQFEGETEFKSDIALTDIKDSKHVFKPKDPQCQIQQIAIRRNQATAQGKRFVIDKELWEKLSPRSQAGLILHEVIYEHLYKLNEEDSVRARELNAFLFSERAFQEPAESYWRVIKNLKLPIYK